MYSLLALAESGFTQGEIEENVSQPGAFAQCPVDPFRATDTPCTDSIHDETLLEARIVDDVEIAQAQPVDLEAQERLLMKQRWTCRYLTGFMIVVFLTLMTIAILVTTLPKAEYSTETALSFPGSSLTASPVSPTTGNNLDTLRARLPNYTLESLKHPLSPQTFAYEWLNEHQNISTLPLWRQEQVFALACLYYSFDGPTWPLVGEDWLDDSRSECDWFSSFFGSWNLDLYVESPKNRFKGPCSQDGRFQALYLVNTGGSGFFLEEVVMPPEISLLSSLEMIWLDKHDLRKVSLLDMLPPQIVSLKKLTHVHVASSQVSGTIPSHLGLLTGLTSLSLADNHLTGTLPVELGSLASRYALSALDVRGNPELNDSVPEDLCKLGSYLNDTVNTGFAFDCANHTGALCGCACQCI